MRLNRFVSRLLMAASLAFATSGRVVADDSPPPVVGGQGGAGAQSIQTAACPSGALYCQLDLAGAADQWISAQNFAINEYDNEAADDFVIEASNSVRSWVISAIQVSGLYYDHCIQYSGGTCLVFDATIDVATVALFTNTASGRPGTQISAGTAVISPTSMASAEFYINLSPAPVLAASGHYWVSLQVTKQNGQWGWLGRSQVSNNGAVWRNPPDGLATGCSDWTKLTSCYNGSAPDLLFGLTGQTSNLAPTPVLTLLNPPSGLNRDVALELHGYNFAPGAVVSWTVGAGPAYTFTTSFDSANLLEAAIPAARVGPYGSHATVVVLNPGPCSGSCVSNALNFNFGASLYLPHIRR